MNKLDKKFFFLDFIFRELNQQRGKRSKQTINKVQSNKATKMDDEVFFFSFHFDRQRQEKMK